MVPECVVDTCVLQNANNLIDVSDLSSESRSLFQNRLNLLSRIEAGHFVVLISPKLQSEYNRQIRSTKRDYVKAFFDILDDPSRYVLNWEKHWSGGKRDLAHSRCKFPPEDDHVLRTAIRPHPTTIFSEESRMLVTDRCIYRNLRVHIRLP